MTERSLRPTGFLTPDEKAAIEEAVKRAELKTSGEIRVLISKTVEGDPLKAAAERFTRLKMHETKERNGVLILLATKQHAFAIFGDEGIHKHFGQSGWDRVRDLMVEHFKKDDFGGGLSAAVEEVGRTLAEKFPRQHDDVNELSDEVVEE